jgi:hypothetical protein
MTRLTRGLVLGLGLALAIGMVTVADVRGADEKDIKKAQKLIIDLAKESLAGKDISKKAAALKKDVEELDAWMHAYKPRGKGGIGFGPEKTNGIEMKIINMGKRALPAATLAKEADELIMAAHINIVLAEIARGYAPAKPKGGKGKKEWIQHVEDQKKAADELIKAVKAKNAAAAKSAANNLNQACNNCHTDFRD